MSKVDGSLEKLIEEAADLLSGNEQNLQYLAHQISRYLQAAPEDEQNGNRPLNTNLHHLQEQVGLLTSQTETLAALLKQNFEGKIPANYPLAYVHLLQMQEEERAKTAKDLEDTSGQLLANAIFELAAVKKLITDKDNLDLVLDGINALQQELEEGLAELRLFIADLEPNSVLGNFGLVAGLRRYLDKFSDKTGLQTELQVQTQIEPLPNIIETAIFRIIQETLRNIRRHAAATNVQVTIAETDDHLIFSVLDNGVGLDPDLKNHAHRRLGLVGIKEITQLLNGTIQIKSEKNQSTQVILTIPYPKF